MTDSLVKPLDEVIDLLLDQFNDSFDPATKMFTISPREKILHKGYSDQIQPLVAIACSSLGKQDKAGEMLIDFLQYHEINLRHSGLVRCSYGARIAPNAATVLALNSAGMVEQAHSIADNLYHWPKQENGLMLSNAKVNLGQMTHCKYDISASDQYAAIIALVKMGYDMSALYSASVQKQDRYPVDSFLRILAGKSMGLPVSGLKESLLEATNHIPLAQDYDNGGDVERMLFLTDKGEHKARIGGRDVNPQRITAPLSYQNLAIKAYLATEQPKLAAATARGVLNYHFHDELNSLLSMENWLFDDVIQTDLSAEFVYCLECLVNPPALGIYLPDQHVPQISPLKMQTTPV